MGIFLFWAGWTPKVKISLRSRFLYRWRPGGGVNCGCSAMRSSRSWEFLFCFYFRGIRWRCVCMFVCSFLCARAALSVLWVVIRGDPNYVLFVFAYRSFIIFGSARFGLHTTVLVKGLSCFIMMESCANLVFFSFRRYCLIIQICFLIYVFCFFATNKNGEEE